MQVGDWEEALTKFKVSQAEESLALANAKEASIENRAMSLAEGWCCLHPGLPTCATTFHKFLEVNQISDI